MQFLGYLEVVRREGPRERTFLQPGNYQGTDTLSTLVAAFRFVAGSSQHSLEHWWVAPGGHAGRLGSGRP